MPNDSYKHQKARSGIGSRNNEPLNCINLQNHLDSSIGQFRLSQLLLMRSFHPIKNLIGIKGNITKMAKTQQNFNRGTLSAYFLELRSKCVVKTEYFIVLKVRS